MQLLRAFFSEVQKMNTEKATSRKRKSESSSDSGLLNSKRWSIENEDKESEEKREIEYMADDEFESEDELQYDFRKLREGMKKKQALKEFKDLVKQIKTTKI
ncbi:Oidioi.mRNA.OKI2018_I69.chr2.g6024.t1.cds [Oikopleura dioica]|uniref:Oidioi.mRNA.OKI2018_I69.chr2.g6024.t1.cds n=1 Tax=Oikopleura dioica TaxID=34765 RepID=A0ABN7T259_OIKDI|nr:Oidioi.mRNA.OKI2018_I69.chr2.g6024.t1.cds [Oikopleura dioica]